MHICHEWMHHETCQCMWNQLQFVHISNLTTSIGIVIYSDNHTRKVNRSYNLLSLILLYLYNIRL